MRTAHYTIMACLLAAGGCLAFPAAPDFTYHGVVRDEQGRPLDTGEGLIILSGPAGEVSRAITTADRGLGENYQIHLPMDSGTSSKLYVVNALRPAMPFTIKVRIRNVDYVPTQMAGRTWTAGTPGGRERLDLTLGVDSDGDGLPDSWEQGLIDGDNSGALHDLAAVRPGDDLDKDGLSNLQEYLLGTYALDKESTLNLEIKEVANGWARLEFAAVSGRTYSIATSTDLKTWAMQSFAVTPGGEPQPSLRAADTGLLEVYVPAADPALLKKQYFRLRAL